MPSSPPTIPSAATSILHPDEQPVVFTWAMVPLEGVGGLTFGSIAGILAFMNIFVRRHRQQRIRRRSTNIGFSLDRHMGMLVTDQRVLVWTASRHPRRIRDLITERNLDQVKKAAVPYSGGKAWRSVVIETNDGGGVRFRVEGELADRFVGALRA